jgi:hypothetical protein
MIPFCVQYSSASLPVLELIPAIMTPQETAANAGSRRRAGLNLR